MALFAGIPKKKKHAIILVVTVPFESKAYTNNNTNIATENRPSQKERIVLQPSIFRCELFVSVRVEISLPPKKDFSPFSWIFPTPLHRPAPGKEGKRRSPSLGVNENLATTKTTDHHDRTLRHKTFSSHRVLYTSISYPNRSHISSPKNSSSAMLSLLFASAAVRCFNAATSILGAAGPKGSSLEGVA